MEGNYLHWSKRNKSVPRKQKNWMQSLKCFTKRESFVSSFHFVWKYKTFSWPAKVKNSDGFRERVLVKQSIHVPHCRNVPSGLLSKTRRQLTLRDTIWTNSLSIWSGHQTNQNFAVNKTTARKQVYDKPWAVVRTTPTWSYQTPPKSTCVQPQTASPKVQHRCYTTSCDARTVIRAFQGLRLQRDMSARAEPPRRVLRWGIRGGGN